MTGAFDLKRALGDSAEVTLIARQPQFVFIPSLIWVVPGWRRPDQVTFDLKDALEPKGIRFVLATAERIDPDKNQVITDEGSFDYDYLLIATGAHFDWDAVPGIGPHGGNTHSICSLPHALEAQAAFHAFLKNPGPVVLGATQGASCFGAEYEMVFNIDRALREAGVRDRAPITFISAEPYLGHFGIAGMGNGTRMLEWFFKWRDIKPVMNVATERATDEVICLKGNGQGDTAIPFKYAIVIPPFKGVDAIRNSPGLGDEKGFVPTDWRYQHTRYPNIWAAGVAVAIAPPEKTPVPSGVPKTGYTSEIMAKVAAHNIVARIKGGKEHYLEFGDINALCIMDAGSQGVILLSDRLIRPRRHEWLIPGPWSHWAKLGFEKYYLWKMKTGRTELP